MNFCVSIVYFVGIESSKNRSAASKTVEKFTHEALFFIILRHTWNNKSGSNKQITERLQKILFAVAAKHRCWSFLMWQVKFYYKIDMHDREF